MKWKINDKLLHAKKFSACLLVSKIMYRITPEVSLYNLLPFDLDNDGVTYNSI